MSGYLVNFIVYTAAMVGIIFLAVFVYKKFSYCSTSRSKFLNVEECISLGPRKELFVVRAGQERFLVASDVGRTSLILNDLNSNFNPNSSAKSKYGDFSVVGFGCETSIFFIFNFFCFKN